MLQRLPTSFPCEHSRLPTALHTRGTSAVAALVNLFDRSQLFEKMIGYFANDHAITERLTRVSQRRAI
jgi:hypothetical protein